MCNNVFLRLLIQRGLLHSLDHFDHFDHKHSYIKWDLFKIVLM